MNAISRLCLALTAAVLCLSASASLPQYKAAVTNEPSLISYYTFDAGNAADFLAANNGTAAGSVTYAVGIGGGPDKAITLKGSGHIKLGTVPAFDFSSGNGTVEGWVRADWKSSPGYNPCVFADRDGGPVDWSIHMDADKRGVGLWNGSSYQPLSIPAAGTNWHHLAVVFFQDTSAGTNGFSIYWDGQLVGVTSQALGGSSNPTELGSSSVAGAERWIGALDEIAFYGDSLTASAIAAHYIAFLVGDPPQIVTQPQGGSFLPGVPLTLSVAAKGAQLSYQWYKDNSPIGAATNAAFTFPQLNATNAGSYKVVVSNAAGQTPSDVVQVSLGSLPSNLQQYQSAVRAESSLISYYTFDKLDENDSQSSNNGAAQGNAVFGDGIGGGAGKALVLDGSGHVNLGQVDAFDFVSGIGTVEAWVRADWTNALSYNPCLFADRDGGSVNWSVHMNGGKDAIGMWNGTTYQTEPTPGAGTAWHHVAVVFDVDSGTGDPSTSIYWDGALAGTAGQGLGTSPESPTELGSSSVAGSETWVGGLDEVAFYSDALGADAIQAHYTAFVFGAPPVITSEPVGGSFFVGDPLRLIVGAQGLDLTYQWYKDGKILTNATSAEFDIAALAVTDAGAYRVKVSNGAGSTNSADANIAVIIPNLAAYQAAVRAEGSLISYYTFDSSDATDSHGPNNGIEQGNVAFATGIGRGADQALILDGTSHIDLGVVPDFDFGSGKGTVEGWVRADWTSNPGYNPAIFADRDGGPVVWSIHMNSGKDAAGLWNGSTYQPLPIPDPGASWHHLAVVFDFDSSSSNSTCTIYWDGNAVGHTLQGLGGATGSPTELGASASGADGQEDWIGGLDEVAFYGDALAASAIAGHFQSFLGQSTAAPKLSITLFSGSVTISWPASVTGFTLQSSPTLSPASWTPVAGVVNNSVTVTAGSAGFYRLTSP